MINSFIKSKSNSSISIQLKPTDYNLGYLIVLKFSDLLVFNSTQQSYDYFQIMCPQSGIIEFILIISFSHFIINKLIIDLNNNNNNNESRYEWNQVKTTNLNQTNSDLVLTTFDSSELFSDDDHEEEEDDEALAMPAFYKYQRRQKLNGFKFIQIEQPTTTKIVKQQQQTAFSKLKQQSNNNKPNNRCLHKPKPVKQTTKASKQNLIITLSENRKDTLRSAVASTSSSSSKRDLTNKSSKSAFKQPNIKSSSIESTPMKQQSLLDMLKQRKRKTPSKVIKN